MTYLFFNPLLIYTYETNHYFYYMNSEFYSENEICRHITKFKDELEKRAWEITSRCGNRHIEEIVQDTYIKSCQLFLNVPILFYEFKKQVIEVCAEISWEYLNNDRDNPTKPRGFAAIKSSDAGGWGELGADFQWEVIEDNRGNAENRMIAVEEIQSIKDYKGKWLPYRYAIQYVHLLQLRDKSDWDRYCNSKRKLTNIPNNPDEIYADFKCWDTFLGIKYLSYTDCCNWIKDNVLASSQDEWEQSLSELPKYIPLYPHEYYVNLGWIDWDTFLSVDNVTKNKWMPYLEAQKWIQDNLWTAKLTESTWGDYLNGKYNLPPLPFNIPPNPHEVYMNTGWISYYRWFGTALYHAKLFPTTYDVCAKWVKANIPLVITKEQYQDFCNGHYPVKKPDWIPSEPNVIYKNRGWFSWNTFLGVNGYTRKSQQHLLSTKTVRIEHEGEKFWVEPKTIHNESIIGIVVSAFCKIPMGSEIKFKLESIIQTGSKISNNKVKKMTA